MIVVQIVADRRTTTESLVSVKCHKIEPDVILTNNVILHTVEPISLMFSGSTVLTRRWSVPKSDINDWCEVDLEATKEQTKKDERAQIFERLKEVSKAKQTPVHVKHTPEPIPVVHEEPVPTQVVTGRHIDLDLDDD